MARNITGQPELNLEGKEFLLTPELQTKDVSTFLKLAGVSITANEIRNKLKHGYSLEVPTAQGLLIVRLSQREKIGSRYMCDVSVRPRSLTTIAA